MLSVGDMCKWDKGQGKVVAIADDTATVLLYENGEATEGKVDVPLSDLQAMDDASQDDQAAKMSSSPGNYAHVPDPQRRATWSMPIHDPEHIGTALTSLAPGANSLPPEAIPAVLERIKGKIDALEAGSVKDSLQHRFESVSKRYAQPAETPVIKSTFVSGIYDTAVKALNDDGDRIGGYLALWGSPEAKDLQGDYFTPDTNFELDWSDRRPVLYHHGLDGEMQTTAVGVMDVIKADAIGLWAEAQLTKRNRYIAQVKQLVAKGALAWSSGSLPHLVKRAKDGQLLRWPIVEGSLTPTPAEPRGTDVGYIAPGKAQDIPGMGMMHFIPEDVAELAYTAIKMQPTWRESSERGKQTAMEQPVAKSFLIDSTGKKMEITQDQLKTLIAEGIAAEKQAEAERQAEAAKDQEILALKAQIKKFEEGDGKKKLPPGQELPAGQPPAAKSNHISVIGNVKYAGMSSEDMGYYVALMQGYAQSGMQKPFGNRSALEVTAMKFMQNAINDPERRLEREISAKALREIGQNRLAEGAEVFLPYKSIDAVESNAYDPTANEAALKALMEGVKANELDNTGQTGYGLEWVPTLWGGELWKRVRQSNPYGSTVETFDMPSNPYKVPIEGSDPTVYAVPEATDATQLVYTNSGTTVLSKVGTGAPSITAKKFAVRVAWSEETNEDTLMIPLIANYRRQSDRALRNAIDGAIVNGDTVLTAATNINSYDGSTLTGTEYYTNFDGLRKYAIITNTSQVVNVNGAPTLKMFRDLRGKLYKEEAADIANLAYVISWEVHMKCLGIPEFSFLNSGSPGSVMTGLLPNGSPDQVGDSARPIGYVDGIPVYVSAQINLAFTDGKISVTGGNNTTGTITLHHRTRWMLGYRRAINIEVMRMPGLSDTNILFGTVRCGLKSFTGHNQAAAVAVNIAVA